MQIEQHSRPPLLVSGSFRYTNVKRRPNRLGWVRFPSQARRRSPKPGLEAFVFHKLARTRSQAG